MMGTHVRFTDTLGYTHVLPVSVLGFRTGADSGNVYVKIDGRCFGAEITPAEYTRLAALLTGEGGHVLGNLKRYCVSRNRVTQLSGCPCVACEVADGQRPQAPEPDPRTPGQVLHAAYCLEFMSSHAAWSDTGEHTRATWERVAAVLAHGRWNK